MGEGTGYTPTDAQQLYDDELDSYFMEGGHSLFGDCVQVSPMANFVWKTEDSCLRRARN